MLTTSVNGQRRDLFIQRVTEAYLDILNNENREASSREIQRKVGGRIAKITEVIYAIKATSENHETENHETENHPRGGGRNFKPVQSSEKTQYHNVEQQFIDTLSGAYLDLTTKSEKPLIAINLFVNEAVNLIQRNHSNVSHQHDPIDINALDAEIKASEAPPNPPERKRTSQEWDEFIDRLRIEKGLEPIDRTDPMDCMNKKEHDRYWIEHVAELRAEKGLPAIDSDNELEPMTPEELLAYEPKKRQVDEYLAKKQVAQETKQIEPAIYYGNDRTIEQYPGMEPLSRSFRKPNLTEDDDC